MRGGGPRVYMCIMNVIANLCSGLVCDRIQAFANIMYGFALVCDRLHNTSHSFAIAYRMILACFALRRTCSWQGSLVHARLCIQAVRSVRSGMSSTRIVRKATLVYNDDTKTPWVPDVIEVDGAEFVKIERRDRGLAKFLGVKAHTSSPLKDVAFLDVLREWRNAAVDKAINDASPPDLFAAERQCAKRRKLPLGTDAPAVVRVEHEDIGQPMNMLFTTDRNKCVAIELTEANLNFICEQVRSGSGTATIRQKNARPDVVAPADQGVHWLDARKVWYVMYFDEDKAKKWKSFRPVDSEDAAQVEDAKEMALAFLRERATHAGG